MADGKNTNILHLSDLHFGMEPSEKIPSAAVDQRNLTLDILVKTLKNLDDKWRPHIVAISGDIAWKSKPEDYEKAGEWITGKLLPALDLTSENIVICPGNHDLDRKKTIGMPPPPDSETADDWLKREHIENFARPFESYVSFCKNLGIPQPEIGEQTDFLTGTVGMGDIRFVILNSAWFCRGDKDLDNLWLGKPLLEKMAANGQLFDENGHDGKTSPVTVVLFHHPPEWLNEWEFNTYGDRQNTLERLCLRSHIILNGHVHARPAEPNRLFNRAWQVRGGASYAENAYKNHFSILRIDTGNRYFERMAWEFDPGKNKWRKDTETATFYDLKLKPHSPVTESDEIKVFISYAREDYDTAKCLYDGLKVAGITPWMDKMNLVPGQVWRPAVTKAIRECRFFIALLSCRSVSRKGFFHTELKKALEFFNEFPEENIFLIPLRIDECEIPQNLEHIHCADLFQDYDDVLNAIINVIQSDKLSEIQSPPRYFYEYSSEKMSAKKSVKMITDALITGAGVRSQAGKFAYNILKSRIKKLFSEKSNFEGEMALAKVGEKPIWEPILNDALIESRADRDGRIVEAVNELIASINETPESKTPKFTIQAGQIQGIVQAERIDNLTQYDLSDTAETLLIEASKDNSGIVIMVRTFDGLRVQTNKKNFTELNNPRSEAIWENAVKELCNKKLLEERGERGEMFGVTSKGYEIADSKIIK